MFHPVGCEISAWPHHTPLLFEGRSSSIGVQTTFRVPLSKGKGNGAQGPRRDVKVVFSHFRISGRAVRFLVEGVEPSYLSVRRGKLVEQISSSKDLPC